MKGVGDSKWFNPEETSSEASFDFENLEYMEIPIDDKMSAISAETFEEFVSETDSDFSFSSTIPDAPDPKPVKIFGRINKEKVNMGAVKKSYVNPTQNMGRYEKGKLRSKHITLFGLAARYERARTPEAKKKIETIISLELHNLDPAAKNALLTMRAPNGETLLETLSRDPNNLDIVERLLKQHATADGESLAIDQFDANGRTILHKAVENNQASLVSLLGNLGANFEIQTTGQTPAEMIAQQREDAKIEGETLSTQVEAYLACKHASQNPLVENRGEQEQRMQELLREIQIGLAKYPHDPNLKSIMLDQLSTDGGAVPLTQAVLAEDQFLTELFIKNGASSFFLHDILNLIRSPQNEIDFEKVIAFAKESGVLDQALKVADHGNYPLHIAAMRFGADSDEVKILIENGADPGLKNAKGLTYEELV